MSISELSSLRSRPPRLSESDGGQAQLECWNNGLWKDGVLVYPVKCGSLREISRGELAKFLLTGRQ